jgi:hypothetical protein
MTRHGLGGMRLSVRAMTLNCFFLPVIRLHISQLQIGLKPSAGVRMGDLLAQLDKSALKRL